MDGNIVELNYDCGCKYKVFERDTGEGLIPMIADESPVLCDKHFQLVYQARN